jgi:hypothetical protein
MALPRRTDVLKLPTRDCAARSDLLNAEDGEAEPRLSSGEQAMRPLVRKLKRLCQNSVTQKTLTTKTSRPKDTNDQKPNKFLICAFESSCLRG